MKQREDGFYQPDAEIDPAVASTLNAGGQRAQMQRMGKAERAKAKRAKEKKEKQAARNEEAKARMVSWLIDPAVKAWVKDTAAELGCSESQVAEFALRGLMWEVEEGRVRLREYLKPVSHPRYLNRLIFP